jgi:hypothetical protein
MKKQRHDEPSTLALEPRVKVWLETDGDYAFGLGICEILQAVDRAGSIKLAATFGQNGVRSSFYEKDDLTPFCSVFPAGRSRRNLHNRSMSTSQIQADGSR